MKTGGHLKVRSMGDNALGVELLGDPRKPEPLHFRVMFPGGDVDITRNDDGSYWIHVAVNRENRDPEAVPGRLTDARLDVAGKHTTDLDFGDFADPDLYHLAVRVTAGKDV